MAKAYVIENDEKIIIADSDETIKIEGNHYFPAESVNKEYFIPSQTHTTCHWKGEASYNSLQVAGKTYLDSVWHYPKPIKSAINTVGKDFSNYYAFWRGVELEE